MYPTVAQVLDLDVLRISTPQVVAGARSLHRTVRWVHISELADIAGLLRGGELVLTTGIALPDDKEGLTRYIDDLADVPAAGLVVELGRRYRDALPRPLAAAAERRGLPLVALRDEVRFVAVTEAVHALVMNAQLTELRAAETIHATFNELSVEGADPAEVVREVARLAGVPAVLENLSHQVLAFDPAGADPAALLQDWERRSRGVRPELRTGHDARTGWLVTTVGARGQDWGRLVLLCPATGAATVDRRHAVLLERGASALALNRLLERDLESLERQTHRTLLSGILTHSLTTADVTLRARALGVPLDGRRLVGVVLRRSGNVPAGALAAEARLREFAETAAGAAHGRHLSALVGSLDDDSVGLLVSLGPNEDEHAALEGLAAELDRLRAEPEAAAKAPARSFVMAAGSVVDSVREARRTLLEAAQVAAAAPPGGTNRTSRSYYRLPDVRLRGLLHLLRDDARLQTYVERELGPLLSYDAEHGTDLVRILAAYLDSGRNKSAAADAAHLSRPSFYDRLRRVERVLGINLDETESCLSLHVALLALDAVRRLVREPEGRRFASRATPNEGGSTTRTNDVAPARDASESLAAFIAGLPKAELHVHHVGSASPRIVCELAARHPEAGVPAEEEELAGYFTFRDFGHFVEVYLSVVDLIRDADDVRLLTYEIARDMARQNIRYAELTVTPYSSTSRGIPDREFVDAIEDARTAARSELGVALRWCFDIPGAAGEQAAAETTRIAVDLAPEGLVSFGLAGPEVAAERSPFRPYFDRARAAGLHSVPHAGETAGPAAIWTALRDLRAERIGHGTSCTRDPELVRYLAERGVPLEVCLTSNVATRAVPALAEHPVREMVAAGIPVTINSDDPPMFGTNLNTEYAIVADLLGLDAAGVAALAKGAVRASFLDPAGKAALLSEIDGYFSLGAIP